MKRAFLLFNPQAGHGRHSRQAMVERAAAVLRAGNVECTLVPTRGAGTAAAQAREALESGCDTLFACGGDGTVHEVLQSMVASRTEAALGIIPMGTGNVLATNVGIPLDPAQAAEFALRCAPRRLPCGRISYRDANGNQQERYYATVSGVGAHATMIYQSTAAHKNQQGMMAYYKTGFSLLFREPFVPFEMEIHDDSGFSRTMTALEMLALRVERFGGLLQRWRPGGSLASEKLHLLVNHGAQRGDLIRYVFAAIMGRAWLPKGIEFIAAERVVCRPANGSDGRIRAQADGESLGTLPVEIATVPAAFNLLMPR